MQTATIFATIAALALGTNAGVVRRQDAQLAQFRVYPGANCTEPNLGFATIDESMERECVALNPSGEAATEIQSILFEDIYYPAADGCTLRFYTDDACSASGIAINYEENECWNPTLIGASTWGSYQMWCPCSAAGC
ncbi:hypothetical protein GGR56DRAFT_57518 [Xylariaceae sp. FL0804]|nr:hypothetical protein GGR56DRAFT_57518 [Xylariaceae sp. FL0804]